MPTGFCAHGRAVACKGAAQIAGAQDRHPAAAQKTEISHPVPYVLLLLMKIFRHPAQEHQGPHHQLLGNGSAKCAGGVGQGERMTVVQPIVRVFVRTRRGKMQPAKTVRAFEQPSGEIAQ